MKRTAFSSTTSFDPVSGVCLYPPAPLPGWVCAVAREGEPQPPQEAEGQISATSMVSRPRGLALPAARSAGYAAVPELV